MKRKLLDFGLPLLVLVAATAVIALTGTDLNCSALFHQGNSWPVGDTQPWRLLYRYGYYPAWIVGYSALGLLLAGLVAPRAARYRKAAVYLILLLALGPGLLINTVFKDHWGRPRPREISDFGGTRAFHQPWERGVAGKGKSFPSGHGASAFFLAMPYFVMRRSRPRTAFLVYTGGMLYGILMGYARIAQGGHFVSDILWAWGMVHLTAAALCHLMQLDREDTGN